MLKSKKTLVLILVALLLILIPNMVNASETFTATQTINGVEVIWTYTLNEANQIENLKCKNAEVLLGKIAIPQTIDGKNIVSIGNSAFKKATGITEIIIPDSVKEIEYSAFKNCTSLSKVDLGSIESIGFDVFKGCTALKNITIPKTLKNGPLSPVFTNCSNLTNIIFENGLTVIPKNLCASTGITEIIIPDSVKEIEYSAFKNCTSLSKVDLGSIESIGFDVFKGCTALKNITIPKTLKNGPLSPVFTNCSNLTNIIFENGLTVIPKNLCASTGITEITIPDSVKEIEYSAFDDCKNLTKITILDNVTIMGFNSNNEDSVFKNHNEDLTIYCYENSIAASYAIKNNIKHVYLKRTPTENNNKQEEVNKENEENQNKEPATTNKNNNDKTTAPGSIPYTGGAFATIVTIITIAGIGAYAYKRNKDLKGI